MAFSIAFLSEGVFLAAPVTLADTATTLFQENFEDTNFASRGWYDALQGVLSSTEHIAGSTASFVCHFLQGATGCANGAPGRHLFTGSDSVYLSYWIKHSANWLGSGQPYHPHIFLFLTDENNAYAGPAYTHLTTYTEENQGYPQLGIQDGENIDETKIAQNLIGVTESRSVAGCNGTQSNIGQSNVDCYSAGAVHWNGMDWKGPTAYFFDPNQKNNWHFVESYFKLNSISGGIGQPDGIIQYWYDRQLVINHQNVILRTGAHPNMKFNQLLMAPYIGDGSPVDQYFWIDNLTVATARSATDTTAPAAPTGVRAH